MYVKFEIRGLDDAEKNARKILDLINEIKRLQKEASWNSIEVCVIADEEPPAATEGPSET